VACAPHWPTTHTAVAATRSAPKVNTAAMGIASAAPRMRRTIVRTRTAAAAAAISSPITSIAAGAAMLATSSLANAARMEPAPQMQRGFADSRPIAMEFAPHWPTTRTAVAATKPAPKANTVAMGTASAAPRMRRTIVPTRTAAAAAPILSPITSTAARAAITARSARPARMGAAAKRNRMRQICRSGSVRVASRHRRAADDAAIRSARRRCRRIGRSR
jgi:hypothetical protein